jgi:hypothetical protein
VAAQGLGKETHLDEKWWVAVTPKYKLTMAEAEKVARAKDPELWDRLTAAERRELVKAVNDHATARVKASDLLGRTIRPRPKR